MKKTGELLKKARESKGLSLHEIGLSLKINSKILKAIEDGDQKYLPAKTFLRGFVQSYAQYLKLNSDEVMAVFAEEMGSTRPAPILNTPEETPEEVPSADQKKNEPPAESIKIQQRSEFQIKPVLTGLVVVILLSLIFMVKRMVDRYQKEAVVQTVQVDNPLPAESTLPIPAKVVSAEPALSPIPSSSPEPSPEIALSKPTEDILIEAPKGNELYPSPTPEPKKPKLKVTESTLPESKPSPTPKPTMEAEKIKKPVELIVEAMDTVEIEYSSLTGKSGKLKLSAEQVHTFKSSNGLKLIIDNGGAVNLILNGRDLGVPGELGKPIRLTY